MSGVREIFWLYFCDDIIIGSKDTEPQNTDVTFLFEYILPYLTTFEHRREKTDFLHMQKQRRLCFRYTHSAIPLLPKSGISSLY